MAMVERELQESGTETSDLVLQDASSDSMADYLTDSTSAESRKLWTELDSVGYGFFHFLLLLVAGWALVSDSVEVLCVSFISPAGQEDLKLTKTLEGWLDASIFIGMMIGGYFWGSWADVVGRRTCLMNSLLLNGVSGLVSAFMPTFGWFLTFRIFSGIGVGGSMPVIFSYFTEFFSKRRRGPFIILLSTFWTLGQVYAALLAWAIIPQHCIEFKISGLVFHNWRLFAVLCTVPSLSSVLFLFFMPESPGYLLHVEKYAKLEKCYQTISAVNSLGCRSRKRTGYTQVQSSSHTKEVPLETVSRTSWTSVLHPIHFTAVVWSKLKQIFQVTLKLFSKEFVRRTVVLVGAFFTLSFGYYGLQLWFPEYFKRVIDDHSGNSSANHSDYNGCTHTDVKPYLDSLYEASASIPGNVLGIFLINIIGGKLLLTFSMLGAGASVFLIWWVTATETVVVLLGCLFNAISIAGWNALNVLSADSFPTELRSTALGFQAAIGRIAAIGGNLTFGAFYDSSPTLPILIVAVCLFSGGVIVLFLPAVSQADRKNILARCLRHVWQKLSDRTTQHKYTRL